jgi:hypothetical protein
MLHPKGLLSQLSPLSRKNGGESEKDHIGQNRASQTLNVIGLSAKTWIGRKNRVYLRMTITKTSFKISKMD